MWSISPIRSLGSVSMRQATLFALAILPALFATILAATPVGAQTPNPDATPNLSAEWNGDTIRYGIWDRQGDDPRWSLQRADGAAADNPSVPNLTNTVCANSPNVYYSSIGHPDSEGGKPTILVACTTGNTGSIDKTKPVSVQIILFRGTDDNQKPKDFAPSEPTTISVLPEGTDPIEQAALDGIQDDSGAPATTCDSTFTHGLGWIICPVTNWLTETMDFLYKALSSFLVVSPLLTDKSNVMYYMWDLMRNFANILFIIGFLVIIYSQTTSYGMSNYGLKRLLPRLIIAAVLVNISYWISAAAIDLSNVLGVSLKESLDAIRDGIPKEAGQTYDYSEMTWKTLAGVFLSGSAVAFAGITGIVGIVASAGGSLWFLLIGVAGVILSGLVALLVLAARQALITVLVIISPLAFVAYLLPSTEKYFDKWKDLFLTMLLVYPIFSIIFGGSQLAGIAIMQNARPQDPNFFNIIVLGMIVQVAPVIITPLLIKLSGSLLGRIAGMVNNPNRGIVDQTRKFAQSRHDTTKKRQIGETRNGTFAHNNLLARAARWNSVRETDKSHRLKAYDTGAEAAYELSSRAHDTHRQAAINEMLKSTGSEEGKAAVARDIANREALRQLYTRQQVSQEEAEHLTSQNKTVYEIGRTRPRDESNLAIQGLYKQANTLAEEKRKETMRQSSITAKQEDDFYAALNRSQDMREYTGAKEVDDFGDLRAKVTAQSKLMAASSERVKNYEKSFLFDNIDKNTALKKATREIYTNDEEWEAAINYVFQSKDTDNIIKLHEQIHLTKDTPEGIRQAFDLAAKGSPTKPIFATASRLGDVAQGKRLREDGDGVKLTDEWQIEAAMGGKYATADLVRKASKEEIGRLAELLAKDDNLKNRFTSDQRKVLHDAVREVFKNGLYRAEMGDREANLRKLGSVLEFGDDDYTLRVRP